MAHHVAELGPILVAGLAIVKLELFLLDFLLASIFYHFLDSVHRLKDFLQDVAIDGIFPLAMGSLKPIAAVDCALELVRTWFVVRVFCLTASLLREIELLLAEFTGFKVSDSGNFSTLFRVHLALVETSRLLGTVYLAGTLTITIAANLGWAKLLVVRTLEPGLGRCHIAVQ